jgi:hypothetical protein
MDTLTELESTMSPPKQRHGSPQDIALANNTADPMSASIARLQLQRMGMTALGINQVLSGQPISNPADRAPVARIVQQALAT